MNRKVLRGATNPCLDVPDASVPLIFPGNRRGPGAFACAIPVVGSRKATVWYTVASHGGTPQGNVEHSSTP